MKIAIPNFTAKSASALKQVAAAADRLQTASPDSRAAGRGRCRRGSSLQTAVGKLQAKKLALAGDDKIVFVYFIVFNFVFILLL